MGSKCPNAPLLISVQIPARDALITIPMSKEKVSTRKPNGYTQVVVSTGSRTIYIAGQTAVDSHGDVVGSGDFRAQAKQAFEDVKAALAAAGVGFNDVVKLNYYVLDMANAPSVDGLIRRTVDFAAVFASLVGAVACRT